MHAYRMTVVAAIGSGLFCLLIRSLPAETSVRPLIPVPAAVWEYPIHVDGGMVYDPLRREAEKSGQLASYQAVATTDREMQLNGL